MQNIIYTEFLPSILPQETLRRYQLDNFESSYKKNVSPVILVEFSTAAFRMGHSLVSSLIELYRNVENPEFYKSTPLDEHFFNSSMLRSDRTMGLLFHSLSNQKSHKIDQSITDSIRNKLFKNELKSDFGLDLAALNIQVRPICVLTHFFLHCFTLQLISRNYFSERPRSRNGKLQRRSKVLWP